MVTRVDKIETAPLNKIPGGLLDFFGIKSFGQNPQYLEARVQPTLDMLLWYAQTNATYFEVPTITLTVANQPGGTLEFPSSQPINYVTGGTLRVPENEVWFVHEFLVKTIYGNSGDFGEFWPAIHEYGSAITRPQPCETSAPQNMVGAAAYTRTAWATMTRPIFVPPGATLCAYHGGYTSAANSLGVQAIGKFNRMLV